MKEVKAYVRKSVVKDVIEALENAGFNCISLLHVPGLGLLSDPEKKEYSAELFKAYSTVVKIEIACKNEDADQVVEIIRTQGRTQHPGGGIILVSPVDRAVKIRTGEEGKHILQA